MGNIFDDMTDSVIDFNEDDILVKEAVYPDKAPFNRVITKQIMLPQGDPVGRGNICFLYTTNTDQSIKLINKLFC